MNQSIILNFNKDFVNSKPYDYTQAANKILDLIPNSAVALYTATLQRKPIVILKDVDIQLVTDRNLCLPSQDQMNQAQNDLVTDAFVANAAARFSTLYDTTHNGNNNFGLLAKKSIPKGEYTRGEFIDIVRGAFQESIVLNLDRAKSPSDNYWLPYDYRGGSDKEGVFMGLVNNYTAMLSPWTTANVSVDVEVGLNIQAANLENTMYNQFSPDAPGGNYEQHYILGDVPVNVLAKSQFTNGTQYENEASQVFYNVDFSKTEGEKEIFFGFFSNHAATQEWREGGSDYLTTAEVLPDQNDGRVVNPAPQSWMGVRHIQEQGASSSNVTAYIDILVNSRLMENGYDVFGGVKGFGTTEPYEIAESMMLLQRIKIENNNLLGQCGFRFYYIDQKFSAGGENSTVYETRRYYWQYFTNRTNNAAGMSAYQSDVMFDSRNFDWYIPEALAEAGFLPEGLKSRDDPSFTTCTGGLCPFVAFDGCDENCIVNQVKYTPTYLKKDTVFFKNVAQIPMLGIKAYGYDNEGTSQEIKTILGVGSSNYSATTWGSEGNEGIQSNTSVYYPANYPQDMSSAAGIQKLYSDNTEYNIEIPSLPIRTFNTTAKSNCVSGNERPILFNTSSLMEGELSAVDETYITRAIVPYTEKFLALRNEQKINLNSINVQIRHSADNSPAEEITDAKVEIIIRN